MVLCVLKIKYAFVSSLYFYKQILSVNPIYNKFTRGWLVYVSMFSFFQGRYVLRGFNEHEKTERVFSQLDQILGEQRLLEQLIREVRFFFIISIAWRYWRYWRLSLHLFLVMLKLNGTQLINLLQCLSCSDINGDI